MMRSRHASLLLSLLFAVVLGGCSGPGSDEVPVLHKVSSQRSISDVRERLVTAAKAHKFGVVTTHNLREMMKKKGVAFERDVVVVEVCNPHYASQVLSAEIGISAALPCRISLYREGDATILATMSPALMIDMFGREDLRDIAATVQETLYAIMAEAAE